jgi:hypothetical protein
VRYRVEIYQKISGEYRLAEKSDYFTSRYCRVFSFGSFYGYSVAKEGQELLEVISCERGALREMEGVLNCPEQVYVNYCESDYVLSYDKYFVVFRVQ